MIYGTISGQNIKIADTVTAAETNNTLTAKFTFSKEWERLKKIAYFRKSGEESFPFVLENDCIPARAGLNLTEGEWEISIRGYDLRSGSETENTAPRLTTGIAALHVWETVSPGENEFPEVPKTLAEQILAAAEDAKETAADVERRANAGEFDGKDGNDTFATVHFTYATPGGYIPDKTYAEIKNAIETGKAVAAVINGEIFPSAGIENGTIYFERSSAANGGTSEQLELGSAGIAIKKDDAYGYYSLPSGGVPESDLSKTVQDKLNSGGGGGGEGGGLTTELTDALVTYFTHVTGTFDDNNGQRYINAVLTALGATPEKPDEPDVKITYSVTTNLDHCRLSNSSTSVNEGDPYRALIIADDGYSLSTASCTVGGISQTISDGEIFINAVYGDIVINAVCAKELQPIGEATHMLNKGNIQCYSDEGQTAITESYQYGQTLDVYSPIFDSDTTVYITLTPTSAVKFRSHIAGAIDPSTVSGTGLKMINCVRGVVGYSYVSYPTVKQIEVVVPRGMQLAMAYNATVDYRDMITAVY